MRMVRQLGKALACAALMLGVAGADAPQVGRPAPPYELRLRDGTLVTDRDLAGRVVVLNFWATWCTACREEMPMLDRLHRARRAEGLSVFLVNAEGPLPLQPVAPFLAGLAVPAADGIEGGFAPIGGAVPSSFVIDRAGRLRFARAGPVSRSELDRILAPLLRERPPDTR